MTLLASLLAPVWKGLAGSLQWRLLWLTQSKFMIGVCIFVVSPDGGSLLLLKHRFYPPSKEWALPAGYVKSGESLQEGAARELLEEVGLRDLSASRLVGVRSGFKLRMELALTCSSAESELRVDGVEVQEARWVPFDEAVSWLDPWQATALKTAFSDSSPGLRL